MLFKSFRLKERQEGLNFIHEMSGNDAKVLIIHYSCESFVTSHGNTPRVTSISVRNLKNAQTSSFSIHLQAQINSKDIKSLSANDYDVLEKEMLSQFYKFVKKHSSYKWLHWNMRNANYGFEAIKNRYRILGGTPIDIDDDFKFDLPIILHKIYSKNFEHHEPDGKFLNLVKRNLITNKDALTGKEEALAFEKKEYLKLHISTLRKVDMMASIFNHIQRGKLKVNSSTIDIYGATLSGIFEIIRNSWILLLLMSIAGYLMGAALEPLVQRFFGTN